MLSCQRLILVDIHAQGYSRGTDDDGDLKRHEFGVREERSTSKISTLCTRICNDTDAALIDGSFDCMPWLEDIPPANLACRNANMP